MKTKCPLPKGFSGTRRVSVILVAVLALSLAVASAAAAAPFAYISNFMSNSVSVVDPTATRPLVTNVTVGDLPLGVAVNPSGTRVYVANFFSNTVSVIDTATNTVATVPVGANPTGVAVNAAGTRVYVINQGDRSVSVINASTNALVTTIPTGLGQLFGIAVNPAGTRVYLSDTGANAVGVIDATTNTFLQQFSDAAATRSTQPTLFVKCWPSEPKYFTFEYRCSEWG